MRRIFREYVDGQTPRDIAHNLNRDRIAPPRGRAWNASTINGSVQRGTGLLHNELYAGRLIWNRVRMIKDPDTGKGVSRPNPKGEWRVVAVPDLAIVSSDLFDAAQAREKARAITHPCYQRRPRHMLTGLLRCGACGAGMSSKGMDKSKRIRIRCSSATESGICADPKTFYLDTVETAVLNGLTAELRHPEVIAQYVQTYHEERKRLAADTDARRTRLERRLEELTREIERLVNAIAKGHGDPAVLGPQSTTLNEERKCILAELDRVPAATGVIALHPALLLFQTHLVSSLWRERKNTPQFDSSRPMASRCKPFSIWPALTRINC
ncbi:recombinase family protein [Mesorhizobium sp. B2-5-4]|uniref:recombinase family protein n=1 Tax=Mesorhizobium sp. B2-5-4 TaxID=2589926 RepID=UPI001FEDBBDC|nr:recombinase family protein [Mesorhizobium sp. B2-5-4]